MSQTATVDATPADIAPANPAPASTAPEPSVSAGTVQSQGSEATKAAPAEDTFYSGDPNSLPPELQQAYKNMLKDYKSKTSEIADTRRKAQEYDKLSANQQFKDYWSGLSRKEKNDFREQKAEAEKSLGQKISDEDFQKSFESKDGFLNLMKRVVDETQAQNLEKLKQMEDKLTVAEASDVVDRFASEVGNDGKPIRPDFHDLDKEFGLITGFLRVNPPEERSEAAYNQKLNEAYTWATGMTQHYYNLGKSEGLKIVQSKVAASSEMPTSAAKGVYTGPDPKKLTVSERFQEAKKGQRIPQVYD